MALMATGSNFLQDVANNCLSTLTLRNYDSQIWAYPPNAIKFHIQPRTVTSVAFLLFKKYLTLL